CTSLVDQDDVPLAKSFISHRKTEFPRPAASRAMPQPLTPPPTIARSKIRSNRRFPGPRLHFWRFSFRFGLDHKEKRKQMKTGTDGVKFVLPRLRPFTVIPGLAKRESGISRFRVW